MPVASSLRAASRFSRASASEIRFSFVGKAEFEAPPLRAAGGDLQVKPPFVRQLVRLWTWFGVLAGDVGERHGTTPLGP